MEAWIDQLAEALGQRPLAAEEAQRLLGAARDVAHRVERRVTPLAAFLLGSAVGRDTAAGADFRTALAVALASLERLLPPAAEEG
jgi:hypothetical protein